MTTSLSDPVRPVRVRIAPSPTGPLHIGTARTALFNLLFARATKGTFVLRIEDTDRARSHADYERDILTGLAELGLAWDEGPDPDGGPDIGPYGPYRQSQRLANYQGALTRLLAQGDAYRCYCTSAELELARAQAKATGRPVRYQGRCARLSDFERAALAGEGRKPVIRFRVGSAPIVFDDLIRGRVSIEAADLGGDFVIARANGSPLYHFCVVVDDADMAISHVIRGEDHLSNTPKHILLFRALGVEPPIFAHLPLILNADRSKMSKRQLGDQSDSESDNKLTPAVSSKLTDYLVQGFLPEALVNYLALLGWSTGTTEEILSLDELIARFDIAKVNKAGAAFDRKRLEWLNGRWIRRLDHADLAARLDYFLTEDFLHERIDDEPTDAQLAILAPLVAARLVTLAAVSDLAGFLFRVQIEPTAAQLVPPSFDAAQSLEVLRATLATLSDPSFHFELPILESALLDLAAARGWKNAPFFTVLRAAISGQVVTPPLAGCLIVLGRAATNARLEYAITVLEAAQQ